jgi:acetyltransferase-like isoleucine patch superfamily enzyme
MNIEDISEEDFAKLTIYGHMSDCLEANLRRARLLGLGGDNVRVAPGAIVRLKGGGQVGRNCFIGLYCYVNGEVVLEDDVIVGPHCSLTSNTHVFDPRTKAFTDSSQAAIRVGRGSWLCAGASVTAGVSVGKGNLICANAVVTRDTPDYAIVAGLPARQVGRIDPETGEYSWGERGKLEPSA